MLGTRTATVIGLSLVLGAGTVAGVALQSPDATAAASGRTLTFDVRFSPFFLMDFGPSGVRTVTDFQDPRLDPTKGDVTTFRDRLVREGQTVGHSGGSCTVIEVNTDSANPLKLTCQVTYDLPRGQIATQGLATNNPVKHLAIVGGTGAYVGARGEATLTELGNGTGSVTFRFGQAAG